jgi:hypothetical protein
MRSLTLLAALMLTACATPEQQAAQKQAEIDQMVRIYGPACAKLGYQPNSDQWRNCILHVSARDDMQRNIGYPPLYGGWGGPWHGGWGGWWGPYW